MTTVTVQNDNNVTVQLSPQPSINVTIDRGIEGPQGPQGEPGPAGQGVPAGGTTGQALVKKSNTNYDTEWQDQSGGVSSVNGQTGDVVLDAEDVGAATTAQGALADTALQPADIGVTVQELLVSATNIKTVNGNSLLGSGDVTISGGGAVDSVNGQTGVVVLDAADVGAVASAASSTDNAIARFDGTTGELIQNSNVIIDDSGRIGINSIPDYWQTVYAYQATEDSWFLAETGKTGPYSLAGFEVKSNGKATDFYIDENGESYVQAYNGNLNLASSSNKVVITSNTFSVDPNGNILSNINSVPTTATNWTDYSVLVLNGVTGGGVSFCNGSENAALFADNSYLFLGHYSGHVSIDAATEFRIYSGGGNQRFTINTNGAFGLGVTPDYGSTGQALTSQGASAEPIWSSVQEPLVSGTNIKTINGSSLLGSGDIEIGGAVDSVNGQTGVVVLTAADVGAVSSVNGQTGIVVLTAANVGAANQSLVNLLLTGF